MTTWNPRANDLFLAARELPVGGEREAFVRRACAGDVELRGDVLSLLAADQQASRFLEAGAIAAADDRMPREAIEGPGEMVGPYKLLQEIGEGGMGIVFMAEQHRPVRRTVAIKILKPGMDARHVIARFESERQALALMDHPNITRVFDAGETLSGRPFFVMELVKGLQITDFCEERRLTIRQRLELMTAVCKAVQHAHQKGVIHRDLKPTNVMIALYDGLPVPKVIDFGVAKAVGARLTERTLFTEYGAILGTLEYMSPEQAELNQLDVDTRSDIYSLGVLMRWLLESRPASKGRRLLVWDASTGALVMNRVPHANYGFPAFDRDEEHLLLQDPDNRTLHKVEIETGRRIASSPPRFRAVQAAYSAEGRLLAMISQSLFPEVVDAQTWSTVASFPSIGRAASTAWHPQEPWAAFGTYDGEIYRWRVGGSAKLQRLGRGHTDAVDLIVFSPDGRLLASSGPGCVLRFSPDSRRIAVRDASRLIVYEIEESHLYRQLNEVADAAEFSPSDRWLGVSGLCGARIFDARSLRLVADLGLDQCGPVAFHPHEAHLTTFGNFSQAWNWPWKNGELGPPESVGPVSLSKLSLAPQHRGRHAVWSADGTLLALADYRHNRVLLRNVLAKTDHEFTATRPVQVALSPDGKWLAANLAEASRAVVWNITNGDLHLDVAGGGGLNFSGDGKWFCLRTSNSVDLFSLPDFELRHSINLSTSHELSRIPPLFQPNGRLLATVDLAQRVQLINRETAQPIATLDDLDPSPVLWMSFSSDGRRLAVTHAERIAIWDLWELAAALQELGLKPRELTAPKRLTPFREADWATNIAVNRGVLPPADQWYVLWTLMARYEASQGNWPDAVDDMNRGWAQAPLNAADRAAHLAERGSYLQRNLSYQAAIEDWEKSLELDFDEPTAILGLARICVLGPQELRNPNRTQALAAILRAQGKAPQECSLLNAFALVQLGQARAKDVAALEHACLASREVLPLNWRLAAGYFLALHQTREGQTDLAAFTLEETVSSHDDVQSELELDEQDELGRLKLETQAAVRKASSH